MVVAHLAERDRLRDRASTSASSVSAAGTATNHDHEMPRSYVSRNASSRLLQRFARDARQQDRADGLRAQRDGQVVEVDADLQRDHTTGHHTRRDDEDEEPARVERSRFRPRESMRRTSAPIAGSCQLQRRPERQARHAPRRSTAAPAWSDDGQRRADAEEHEVRRSRRWWCRSRTIRETSTSVTISADVLDRGRGGGQRELAARVLRGGGDRDDAVAGRSAGSRGTGGPSTPYARCRRAGPCTPSVSRCTMHGRQRRRRAARPRRSRRARRRRSGAADSRACSMPSSSSAATTSGMMSAVKQRPRHQVVGDVRDRVRRLEDVGEERRSEDRAGDDDAEQPGDAAEERPTRYADSSSSCRSCGRRSRCRRRAQADECFGGDLAVGERLDPMSASAPRTRSIVELRALGRARSGSRRRDGRHITQPTGSGSRLSSRRIKRTIDAGWRS